MKCGTGSWGPSAGAPGGRAAPGREIRGARARHARIPHAQARRARAPPSSRARPPARVPLARRPAGPCQTRSARRRTPEAQRPPHLWTQGPIPRGRSTHPGILRPVPTSLPSRRTAATAATRDRPCGRPARLSPAAWDGTARGARLIPSGRGGGVSGGPRAGGWGPAATEEPLEPQPRAAPRATQGSDPDRTPESPPPPKGSEPASPRGDRGGRQGVGPWGQETRHPGVRRSPSPTPRLCRPPRWTRWARGSRTLVRPYTSQTGRVAPPSLILSPLLHRAHYFNLFSVILFEVIKRFRNFQRVITKCLRFKFVHQQTT